MRSLETLLQRSSERHSHLCPRQVLGIRMGLLGLSRLGFSAPSTEKQILVIVETDGCFTTGLEVAAGVSVGKRTLKLEDFGKTAATFTDTVSGNSFRITPRPGIRELAAASAPEASDRYNEQLLGYQRIPDAELFTVTPVRLCAELNRIISLPGLKAVCALCGEDIINQREIIIGTQTICRACSGFAYYDPAPIAPMDGV